MTRIHPHNFTKSQKYLRRACLEYGYTLAAISEYLGLHYPTVSKGVGAK